MSKKYKPYKMGNSNWINLTGKKRLPVVTYICAVDLAHPNYPNEKNLFIVYKKVSGEPLIIKEERIISNRGYQEEIKDKIDKLRSELLKKYPGLEFKVDTTYRTWTKD